MTEPTRDEAVWRKRWILLNVLTVSGVVIAMLGLVVWRKGILGFQDELAGKLIFLIGIIDALLIPVLLRRAWRRGRANSKSPTIDGNRRD